MGGKMVRLARRIEERGGGRGALSLMEKRDCE